MSTAGNTDEKTIETKVVILGHTGVGKTCLVNQYVRGQFTGNTTATIGAAFFKKVITIDGYTIILQIWDTAGQERFRSMAPMYYRGAHAAVLVFDVSAPETLEQCGKWVEELQGHANPDSVLVMAANKSDLRSTGVPCVSSADAAAYAKTLDATVFETSAKTAKGVEDMFAFVAKGLMANAVARRKQEDAVAAARGRGASSNAAGGGGGGGGGGSGSGSGNVKLDGSGGAAPAKSGCCGGGGGSA